MATASKAFRARAFDSNKSMAIYWGHELPDLSECTTGNRAVTQMPSGMEKEEEMESHLQDAILAQQASTSGVQVNHVIPTPKVCTVEHERYDTVYPCRNKHGRSKYIKVHAWQALEKDEPDYDCDTEDEEWLNDRPHIEAKVLEKIFDTVEGNSSETQIASEDSVLNTHKSLDPSIVYEVYEYWLSKRTSAATTSGCVGVGGLIPKIRTECRKDAQGSVNPYVAFRRRAEKMQTRKNRKNDEDNYEKILKLVHDMSKAKQLFDMTVKREKTKLAVIDMESEILNKRMCMQDFGQSSVYSEFKETIRVGSSTPGSKPLSQINGVSQEEAKKKKKARRSKTSDKDLVSKAWLKRNAESWNRPPSLFGQPGSQSSAETTKPARDAFLDGKYSFKRRRGCVYRAALPVIPSNQSIPAPRPVEQVPSHLRFYETFLPDTTGNLRSIGFARRRIGRGGRMVFDHITRSDQQRLSNSYDPWCDGIVTDTSRVFRAKMHPFGEVEESDEISSTDRHFARSDLYHSNDDVIEKDWISRYQSSWTESSSGKFLFTDDDNIKTKDDDSEVERMDVEEEKEAQITDSRGGEEENEEQMTNGHGKDSHKNEDEEDMDVDEVVIKFRDSSVGKSVPIITPNLSSLPGNGSAGRVEPTPVPAKMCGTVSDSDEWREPSGSPSESNSSTEWGAGFVADSVVFKAKCVHNDEEPTPTRPGERTVDSMSSSIKDTMSTVTIQRNNFLLPSSIGM